MKQNKQRITAGLLSMGVLMTILSGCASSQEVAVETSAVTETVVETTQATETVTAVEAVEAIETVETGETVEVAAELVNIDLSVVPLTGAPAISTVLMPVASGTVVYANEKAEIDASNTADGYVMIRYLEVTTSALKVAVTGPSGTVYYYNLDGDGNYEVFPLSDGNGNYLFQICKNASGTSYAVSYSATVAVTLKDEFAPFLLPNQYVNYTADSQAVAKAAELVAGKTEHLDQISAVYTYVVNNLTYDTERAATVQAGYLPDIDDVMAQGKGICFDYAALMTAMLRSQGIPCKLVVGYAGTAYHAWINTYSDNEGWMDASIYFDGQDWKLMDPTFASGGQSSEAILNYIGDGTNYTAKYLY